MNIKGDITLKNGMKMVLSMNVLADLEEYTGGKSALDFIQSVDSAQPKLSDIRALYYVCLKPNNPDITPYDALDIFNEEQDSLERLFRASLPEEVFKETETGND